MIKEINKFKKVIVIGAGPAGIACAIQLKRQGIEPILIEKANIGGLILNANKIENYPGFPNGISGTQISKLLNKHLEKWNINLIKDEVIDLIFSNKNLFQIRCKNNLFLSEYLVLATGTKPVLPKIKIPDNCIDKIYSEVFPLIQTKNKIITIVGAGDAAFDYANNLSKNNQINILNRTDKIKALNLLVQNAKRNGNIKYNPNTIITEIAKEGNRLKITTNNKIKNITYHSEYLIFAIGRTPNLDLLQSIPKIQIKNLIKSKKLFLIGDVKNDNYRQLSIAVGDGVKAAMKISCCSQSS